MMNIEEINTKLKIYGERLESSDYFVCLAQKLALEYEKYFNDKRIEELLVTNFFLEQSKLDLIMSCFDSKESFYLQFDELIHFFLSDRIFLTFNLKGEVTEFIVDNQKIEVQYLNLGQALEMIMQLVPDLDLSHVSRKLESIYLTSFIYQAAFLYLKEKVNSKISVARAGMFQNAYYHIIGQKLPLSYVLALTKTKNAFIRA